MFVENSQLIDQNFATQFQLDKLQNQVCSFFVFFQVLWNSFD